MGDVRVDLQNCGKTEFNQYIVLLIIINRNKICVCVPGFFLFRNAPNWIYQVQVRSGSFVGPLLTFSFELLVLRDRRYLCCP